LTQGDKTKTTSFRKKDQIAAEIVYFSGSVLTGKNLEPSGREGLADIRIVRALLKSLHTGKPVTLARYSRTKRPRLTQKVTRPPVRKKPKLVRAQPVSP